ncbi:hypothetical protein ACFSKW_06860 [Nonomuraea mangrovi]|uniref:Uncharacterized protein n=1 Tax=Nonomuraea mangrovi TaxID=2316207 RepID=A0ABW4SPW0_9ACTN
MLFRLLYLLVVRVFGWLVLLGYAHPTQPEEDTGLPPSFIFTDRPLGQALHGA